MRVYVGASQVPNHPLVGVMAPYDPLGYKSGRLPNLKARGENKAVATSKSLWVATNLACDFESHRESHLAVMVLSIFPRGHHGRE